MHPFYHPNQHNFLTRMKFSTAINVSEVQNAQEVWSNKKEKSQPTLNTESSPRCHVICESRVSHLVRNVVRPYFTSNFKELYKHIICSGLPDTGGLAHGALWREEDAGHCSPMAKRRLHLHLSLYHCDIVIIMSEKNILSSSPCPPPAPLWWVRLPPRHHQASTSGWVPGSRLERCNAPVGGNLSKGSPSIHNIPSSI